MSSTSGYGTKDCYYVYGRCGAQVFCKYFALVRTELLASWGLASLGGFASRSLALLGDYCGGPPCIPVPRSENLHAR